MGGPDDHRDLGQRFARRDHAALAEVYDDLAGPMFTVAVQILRDRDLAADAVQQAFLQAWQAAERFDPERALAPWLYQIVRRTSIDAYRRRGRGDGIGLDDVPQSLTMAEDPPIDATWTAWEVRQAVESLPDEEQAVVRLTHGEGLSMPETADRLGIPLGTVKSRSHRAHRRLAARLRHVIAEPA